MCRRIINYPKSSRKSEIEKWLFFGWRNGLILGSFGTVCLTVIHHFLKNSWIFKFCVGVRFRSLGTIFWVSGSEFFIWGTSWGPHYGCVNATKLEMVSVFFFSCFWWDYWWGSWPENKFSGQIFEPRLQVGWTKVENVPKLWKDEPGLTTRSPMFEISMVI